MLIRPAIGDTDPIRYRRPTPDGQFSGNIIDEAMRPPFGVGPSGRTGSGYWIDRLPGVLLLKLYRADIAESGVEPSGIVDAVDELGKIFDDVGECLERHWISTFDPGAGIVTISAYRACPSNLVDQKADAVAGERQVTLEIGGNRRSTGED